MKFHDIRDDSLLYLRSVNFIYSTEVNSIDELQISYDNATEFIEFVSEKYPILIDKGLLGVRLDISGITLKGDNDDDKWIYRYITEREQDDKIIPYDDIYNELKSNLKTHSDNPEGLFFTADVGKSFLLGSDTFEDCLYKMLVLKYGGMEAIESIVLQPGEMSELYTLISDNQYKFTEIEIQTQDLSDVPCSIMDTTIIKAVISGSSNIYIEPTWIDLEYDEQREWKDPYEVLNIAAPNTEHEKEECVLYKNVKILFEMNERFKDVDRVTLIFQN